MKKMLPLVFALTIPFVSKAQQKKPTAATKQLTVKPVDAHYGFRDFKFESPISAHPGLVRISEDSTANLQLYQKENENLSVGQSQLESVKYVYYKDRLESILISVSSANRYGLVQAFKTKYGTPTQTIPDALTDESKYLWQGQKALVFIAAPDDEGSTSILLQSKIMSAREKRDAASEL